MAKVIIRCGCTSNCDDATGLHMLECYGVTNERGQFRSFYDIAGLEEFSTEQPTPAGRELMAIYLDTDYHNIEAELGNWYSRNYEH